MARHIRIRLLLLGAVLVIAAAVWAAGDRQRSTADVSFNEARAAEQMLVSTIAQAAALNEYVLNPKPEFVDDYEQAGVDFETALARAIEGSESYEIPEVREREELVRHWQELANPVLAGARAGVDNPLPAGVALRMDAALDDFRESDAEFRVELEDELQANQDRAGLVTVGLIGALSVLFGGVGYLLFDRRARREGERSTRHARFADVLQLARTESEAYQVVKRHLEGLLPGSRATVLNRNNSANRLEASTSVEGSTLLTTLEGADPESCIAIRGGRVHSSSAGVDDLMSCEVCGAVGANVTCVPSLVGGEVIGSVLIEHPKPLARGDADYLASSIGEASPILANLRNLSIAELRAATDGLTGLPNKRSLQEVLKRMAAQAGRTGTSLATVLFDLDHFKQINDTFGHSKGDEVLAAVGSVASTSIRASDLAGRYGGEEFMLLLPDTSREGALEVAEKLRVAIADIQVPGVTREITASFGVAVMPDEAVEPDELVRVSDRALYSAKAGGRNRVETAETGSGRTAQAGPNGARAAQPIDH